MRRYCIAVMAVLLLITVVHSKIGCCEEQKADRSWYRMEIQTGDTTYQCMGSSPLDEKAFAKRLETGEFIVLDDASYLDATGRAKDWHEWDPKTHPRLYINPQYVIFFNPLKGDLRKTSSTKSPGK